MIKQSEAINILLYLVKNVKKYIRFFDDEEFYKEAASDEADGTDVSYPYTKIVDYIINHSPIAARYGDDDVRTWILEDYPSKEEYDSLEYKDIKRDVKVLIDQVRFLYCIKNYELAKNAYYSTGNHSVNEIGEFLEEDSWHMFESWYTDIHISKAFVELPNANINELLRFREDKDCELVSAVVTHVIDERYVYPMVTLIYTTKDIEKDKERPFMFLYLPLSPSDTLSNEEMVDIAFNVDVTKKYVEFLDDYREAIEFVIGMVCLFENHKWDLQQVNESYKFNDDYKHLKNTYKEVEICVLP